MPWRKDLIPRKALRAGKRPTTTNEWLVFQPKHKATRCTKQGVDTANRTFNNFICITESHIGYIVESKALSRAAFKPAPCVKPVT